MIKNGNYYFLDWEAHKDKFIEVFKEFYGEGNEQEVQDRLETTVYLPYLEPEVIYEYYGKLILDHKDELVADFRKRMGLKKVSAEMADMLWSSETLDSPITNCLANGENLEQLANFDPEGVGKLLQDREKAYKLFGIDGENKLDQLHDVVRQLNRSIRTIEERYPCDVFRDIKKYQQNKVSALQMYLVKLAKYGIKFSDKDDDIINNPDIDFVDFTNLDCNHILFGKNIKTPGLIETFSSKYEAILQAGTDISTIEDILKARLQYYYFQNGCEDTFTYVSLDEICGRKQPKDIYDFLERMNQELLEQSIADPESTITPQTADFIEKIRGVYADGLYSGCKFAKNINKEYQEAVHDPDESQWVTYLNHIDQHADRPINHIFFNESGTLTAEQLLANMIHELNHVASRGPAESDSTGKYVYERIGIAISAKGVTDGVLSPHYARWNEGVMSVEENVNERLSQEILDLFLSKYDNPYEESDVPFRKQKDEMECLYDYWNPLTDKFYERYRDAIILHRINPNFDMYYDDEGLYATNKEQFMRNLSSKFRRVVAPTSFSDLGVVDYKKVAELGELVHSFREHVLPHIADSGVRLSEFIDRKGENYRTLPLAVRDALDAYYWEADKIFGKMIADEEKLYDHKTALIDGQLPVGQPLVRRVINDVKRNYGETPGQIASTVFTNLKESVISKFRRPKTIEINLEDLAGMMEDGDDVVEAEGVTQPTDTTEEMTNE